MSKPRLNKHLGQHHLRDSSLCRPLVDFLQPGRRTVVEIGPGGGVLTQALLDSDFRVLALELDPGWAFEVARRFRSLGGFSVAVADALEVEWAGLGSGMLIAGNLPYNVATPLIDRVLAAMATKGRAAFLVQLEVAQRLAAAPRTKSYGALSVLTQARAQVTLLARVRPGSFKPPPKVDSAFVGLERSHPELNAEWADLKSFVHLAFSQRRKTLTNNLKGAFPAAAVRAELEELGHSASARAEEVEVGQFVDLWRRLGAC